MNSTRNKVSYAKHIALMLAIFGLFCFIRVWQNISVDQLNRRNGALLKDLKETENESALLLVEVEELKRPERIKRIAEEKFNFVQARKINLKLERKE